MKRCWSINGRFLTQPLTGVQRYAREIVTALDALLAERHPKARDLELEILVPAAGKPAERGREIRLSAIPVRPVVGGSGHVWEQTTLPLHAHGGLISLCNTGPVAAGKHIVCIHDANTFTRGESYSAAFRALYHCLHPLLGRRASAIATVSHYSAGELARFGIAKPDKIIVAGNGHEHAKAWVPRHSQATREAACPRTVVVLGSLARHKNIGRVLELAPQLGSAGLRIAVAGASDPKVFSGSTEEQTSPHVRWLGRLTDEEMAALISDSLCLAFPSLDEGFGLPPLEAMALGCPVVVSTCASLPEVCGNAALYASPFDSEAWLAAFLRLSSDLALRSSLAAAGRKRAQLFSWRRSAEIYLDAMARADGLENSDSLRAVAS